MRRLIATLCLLRLAACSVTDLNFLKTAETEDPSCPYLITRNPNSYVCDPQSVARAGFFNIKCKEPYLDQTSMTLTCPGNMTISCFIYASYGDVAGSCWECHRKQQCGTCTDCVWKDRCGFSTGGCFNNCVDCFGEVCDGVDYSVPGCAVYFPESFAQKCIGSNSCFMGYGGMDYDMYWFNADDSERISFHSTMGDNCRNRDVMGKFKVLALCE
mmetsp:Transcript_120333/g.300179  ORF Transcript_120333/g.300179 Transcript_120333/m.300179 type:complete len:214 (+) Transcript_120333:137-778(+)